MSIESTRPTMRDLNRYVMKYAADWRNIGIELGLDLDVLDIIEKDHYNRSLQCFQKTLDTWLKLNTDDATWKTLEVALTNVNRTKFGLDPVDDVYGKEVHRSMYDNCTFPFCYWRIKAVYTYVKLIFISIQLHSYPFIPLLDPTAFYIPVISSCFPLSIEWLLSTYFR